MMLKDSVADFAVELVVVEIQTRTVAGFVRVESQMAGRCSGREVLCCSLG